MICCELTTLSGSLDSYLYDPTDPNDLSEDERKRFEKWVSKVLSDPSKISSRIVDALKEGMFSEWEEESVNHHFKPGSYYPSMIEHCLRAQAYSYLHPIPPTHEELNIFGEGRAIHELIALALRRSGLVSIEGKEVVVDLEFGEDAKLHGRIDDLLLIRMATTTSTNGQGEGDKDNFKLFVPLEIKSISSLPDEPRPSHYYQLSTYLLAKNYSMGVLLYWAKRGGEVKAFGISKDEDMYYVLKERVLELHDALKRNRLPRKEASENRDYQQCERCAYVEKCNPFLLDSVPPGSKISLFDIDTTLLDPLPRRRATLAELGLPSTIRPWDIQDEDLKQKFWETFESPKYIELDSLIEKGRDNIYSQIEQGRKIVAVSASRRYKVLEPTRARFANLGVPIHHYILREEGNYESETKFKTRWVVRLAANYEIAEYFDRDAATSSMILKSLEQRGSNVDLKEQSK